MFVSVLDWINRAYLSVEIGDTSMLLYDNIEMTHAPCVCSYLVPSIDFILMRNLAIFRSFPCVMF